MPFHPKKILAQAGVSLADAYDVEGSIVGVENLDATDVKTVHEMGATIHAERIGGTIIALSTGALAQSITWNTGITLAANVTRILGLQMISNSAARTARAAVMLTDLPPTINDLPIMWWDTGDTIAAINMTIEGTLAAVNVLQPTLPPLLPNLLIGTNQQNAVPVINFRGVTTAFGAGTVVHTLMIYTATAGEPGVSSRGLPTPSW